MTKHNKKRTKTGMREIYNRVLVSMHKIGSGITSNLVWQFVRPYEVTGRRQLYYETDLFELARVLSVFGVKQSKQYPFSQYRNSAAVAALAVSNRRIR